MSGPWAGEVRDTQGKVQLEVEKGMPKGKEQYRAQWTSGLKAASHSWGGDYCPMLTPASEMPASSRQDEEPQETIARAEVTRSSESHSSRVDTRLNP